MGLASSTMVQTDKSLGIAPLHEQILRDGTRSQRVRVETGGADIRVDELHAAAPDRLLEVNCRTREPRELCGDENFIIEDRRAQIVYIEAHYHELQPALGAQLHLIDSQRPQPIGAAALEEFQVVCIVDDAPGIGIFPVAAEGAFEPRRSHYWPSLNKGRLRSRSITGAVSPKCA